MFSGRSTSMPRLTWTLLTTTCMHISIHQEDASRVSTKRTTCHTKMSHTQDCAITYDWQTQQRHAAVVPSVPQVRGPATPVSARTRCHTPAACLQYPHVPDEDNIKCVPHAALLTGRRQPRHKLVGSPSVSASLRHRFGPEPSTYLRGTAVALGTSLASRNLD